MDFNSDFFNWVRENSAADPAALRLKYAGKTGSIDFAAAITQIECRRKFGRKLADTLAAFPAFFFPSTLAGEQASSDLLAEYHTSLVPQGLAAVDFTAGLGIDALHIARRAASVVAVERNEALVEALRYNARGLHVDSVIEPVCADCVEFIDRCIDEGRRFDIGFIDPARRAADGARLFALADCSPDVVSLLPKIARICRMLVIKASPMLDITHTVSSLPVKPTLIAAAGTPTECKELVVVVVFDSAEPNMSMIESVTLLQENSVTFAFTAVLEANAPAIEVEPPVKAGDVICEPYPAVMKSGASRILAKTFGLRGFHDNTKLYYAPAPVNSFPGTMWTVTEVLPYASSVIKRFKNKYPSISIVTRNFGMTADALRSRLAVREAPGDLRLFAVTDARANKLLIVTRRL